MPPWTHLPTLVSITLMAIAPAVAHGCRLPAPEGIYAVGFQRFELTDPGRHGVSGDAPEALRVLPVYIWYPADGAGPPRAYLTAPEAAVQMPALARNLRYAPEDVARLGDCETHSTEGGAPLHVQAKFPLVLLSHGFFLYPAQNTALAEELASHGYVVIALAHPGDSVDVGLADGRVVPTNLATEKAAFREWRRAFHSASSHDTRAPLLDGYAQAFAGSRLGASVASWRDDILFVARSLEARKVPNDIRPVLELADQELLGLIGMSFGGSTVATACRRLPACKAAISLDGQNFDPDLFDDDVQRPLLVLLSDWVRFPMYDGLPSEADFNPNDYAYERWDRVGLSADVYRLRVPGTEHMSFTDLPLLMSGDALEARFGDADPVAAARAINAVSLAFLDTHLKGADGAGLQHAIEAWDLVPHDPASTRAWAESRRQRDR